MKVFVATREGQGRWRYDVCTTIEGELVVLHDCETDCIICRQKLVGVVSGGDTTTFTVVDRPDVDRDLYTSFMRDGLANFGCESCHEDLDTPWLDRLVDEMLNAADVARIGRVYGRVDDVIWERSLLLRMGR